MTATSFLLFLKTFCFGSLCSERFGRLFPTLGVPTERRCLRPWWNCSITPNAGVNVPPMWGWSRRTAATGGDDAGALLHRWYGRHWKARLNEMFWEFPKMFCSRTLVGCFFWDVHILFVFLLGSEQIFVVLESDSFLQLWVSHRHRLLQEFGDMAQHTKAVLKSVSIAPVDPTGEKGVLWIFFCSFQEWTYVERQFRIVYYIFRVTLL